jgi:hypothetical protein
VIVVGGDDFGRLGFKRGFMEVIERTDLAAEKKSSPLIS